MLCSWNIAKHDLDVKMRQVEEFLNKGKMVAVSTTYEYRGNKWQEQYPKAVQVHTQTQAFAILLIRAQPIQK